jgi:hypothetical protein
VFSPSVFSPSAASAASAADAGLTPTSSGTEAVDIYGPDDPAYGPPGPGWYQRGEESAARPGGVTAAPEAGEAAGTARGPFEPLRSADQQGADYPDLDPADDYPGDQPGAPDDEPAEDDGPDFLDFGSPTDPEAGALGDIRDTYLTAEAIGPARLERHFDELLERQRQLISEYFEESAAAPAPAGTGSSAAPFGFDTADSLAALRGELRGTP